MTKYKLNEWEKIKNSISINNKAFINGKFQDSISNKTFGCINPSNGELITNVSSCDENDVDIAVKNARKTFDSGVWSMMSPSERKMKLIKLSELIIENIDEFSILDSIDMGKPVEDCVAIDVPGAAAILQWTAEAIDKLNDEIAPTDKRNLALVKRVPLGVIGAVIPWNFPLDMAIWKCAPSLAMGNSVILKPAEQSPLSALKLAEISIEAGIPEGVLNVLPGHGEITGKAIGLHDDIDCVAFTGSTEVGKYFLKYAGKSNMKQIWLECGGKSPNLIFQSSKKLEEAAKMAAQGAFFNQGEVCSANSRILVQETILDEFKDLLIKETKNWKIGLPLDPSSKLGSLVSKEHASKVRNYIEIGKKETNLIFESQTFKNNIGTFVSPIIFQDDKASSVISKEEIFGPVACITPFKDMDDAIKKANDTVYGLAASVWSDDLTEAHLVSELIKAGTVSINSMDALSPMTPFGGFKNSGFGKDLSLHSFDKYTGLKTIWIKY